MRMPHYMTGKTRTENGKVILHIKVKWWGWPILFVRMMKMMFFSEEPKTCVWQETDCDNRVWETECGNTHLIYADTPIGNGMKYCCYCGKMIETEE